MELHTTAIHEVVLVPTVSFHTGLVQLNIQSCAVVVILLSTYYALDSAIVRIIGLRLSVYNI